MQTTNSLRRLQQKSLERILYCWAIRHPASGYVQGINDLVTPFFQVFLQEAVGMRLFHVKYTKKQVDNVLV